MNSSDKTTNDMTQKVAARITAIRESNPEIVRARGQFQALHNRLTSEAEGTPLSILEKSEILLEIATTLEKVILLERSAFGID